MQQRPWVYSKRSKRRTSTLLLFPKGSRSPSSRPERITHQCLKLPTETSKKETTQVCFTLTRKFNLFLLNSEMTITDGRDSHRDHPRSTQNQPLQGESNFGDSSGPLFSIYSKAVEEEDDKMVDRWQKDADGILIFVSSRVGIHISLCINSIA